MNSEAIHRLQYLQKNLEHEQNQYLGYPNAHDFNFENLAPFLNLVINNIGDPFEGNSGINTCDIETEVIRTFANWVHLADPWGYITNGSTESNMRAILLGKQRFPDAVVICSRDSHYSIRKICNTLDLKCIVVESQSNGEISYDHFHQVIKSLKQYPLIICANIGTTMKGAIDSIKTIEDHLRCEGIQNYHLHCDAAQFGGYLPFLDLGEIFDFRNNIHSMSVSGHKFFGSPIPCGIFVTKSTLIKEQKKPIVEYIGSSDSTISGSRNGLTPLILWQSFQTHGTHGFRERACEMMALKDYALNQLSTLKWPSWANNHSNTVVIARPHDKIARKWKLAVEGAISHVITVPGVTRHKIDEFTRDLADSPIVY
jgi:histidine decarboxylase